MVKEINLYFEGERELRPGFSRFFSDIKEKVRESKIRFKLVAGGGREDAVKDFMTALNTNKQSLNMLLIDSEGPDNGRLFQDLQKTKPWKPPEECSVQEDQVLWMVQCMETWFVADPESLEKYYRQGFNKKSLPGHEDLEKVDKQELFQCLDGATRNTQKGKYSKAKHSQHILGKLDAVKVKASCSHCKRSFEMLEKIVSQ